MRDPKKSLTLIVAGLGFLYFGWLFSTTGIFTGNRGSLAIAATEEPDRFSYAVGTVFVIGLASLVAGLVTMLRK